jgi:type VI secretion system secreted protein VgrG
MISSLGYTQDARFLSLTTPLGKDALLINSFTASEKISDLFRIEVEALFKGATDLKSLLGQSITVGIRLKPGGEERYLHGMVAQVEIGNETERFRRCYIVAYPRLYLTTLSAQFRVFEKKTAIDIVKELLGMYGVRDYRFDTGGGYTEYDHVFQYRETTFNFLSRLLEHEGIFYYFEHSEKKHTLVFADKPSDFKASPFQTVANFAPAAEVGPGEEDYVTSWETTYSLRTEGFQAYDYHFEDTKPSTHVVNAAEPVIGTSLKLEEYPARTVFQFNKIDRGSSTGSETTKLVRIRMEEQESVNPEYVGMSTCKGLGAGQKFALKDEQQSKDYVITAVEHSGMQAPPYISGMESDMIYSNSLTCMEYGSKYRAPRVHQKPIVSGPQTAEVIEGPDKYSRVKVKFHWGSAGGNPCSSAWVRVAQRWSGTQYGSIFIPRVGHEVIVDFVDGDPDHPLIVGSVYNKKNMPPYELPANKTQSGIKTRSMDAGGKEGGASDFNELRFEDKTGQEDIYFHAQKDFHRVVENDDDLKVGHDQTIEIKNHRTETVKDGNEKVTIETGNRSVYVNKGNDLHQVKMGNREAIVDMGNDTLTIKMGNHIRKINLGKSETEALQSIELKVGQSSVKLDQMGVTIKGMMIKIEGTIMVESKGVINKMNGTAMVQVQGGITMIN